MRGLFNSVFPLSFALAAYVTTGCHGSQTQESEVVAGDSLQVRPEEPNVRPVHWSYEDSTGPGFWAELSPAYQLCGTGTLQSPIDISSTGPSATSRWQFRYGKTPLQMYHTEHVEPLIDNGHTIQIPVEQGSELMLDGAVYALKQFHFHTPSEHSIGGVKMPMEIHFVHQSADQKLAVVGVMVREGKENPLFRKMFEHLPKSKGDTVRVSDHRLDLSLHLPKNDQAYRYVGSLTTPPCTEGVEWLVLAESMEMSSEQIHEIHRRIGTNNRPTQAMSNRKIESLELLEVD